MAHVHLLAAWQHNDIDKIKQLISKRVHVFLTKENGATIEMNYETLTALIQQSIEVAIKNDWDWQFDVMHKTERGSENIVVIKISISSGNFESSEEAGLCVLTFDDDGDARRLIRAYIENNVANN
ncbi:hypothetical protein [Macrococcoides caseolyticum]|uniref:Uncharacterized protein n=2 Tax=Macrococcoides caseolyticum TaxID=69966 RepID=A0ACC9MQR0_9STAP|nr:hypothetical protein [Macrococcus caseolyticus]ARQ05283.1 hypothetical protein CA207_20890 [Macrococcus caseolyticus]MDJ1155310.1 hypothetical protein [Macrococcus caseolyticus]PKE06335.1 hypothetical protein CW692_08640 [Macrococcus caseolyticus]PKE17359.1 hypothetical protein CW718_04350 [Macrococcus caseolyticus]PKE19399.1 hypothetical protein CW679_05645 [Macrococcus caseolyticus]